MSVALKVGLRYYTVGSVGFFNLFFFQLYLYALKIQNGVVDIQSL
ncbi:hypothetical protein [Streptococcus ruminantium]|nr:hypothetical protein [Streptococcus ruminantium]BDD38849.1 hypothetical protein GUT183_10870 [Streptococcus ruminantium]